MKRKKVVCLYPLQLDAKADQARNAFITANSEANEREGVSSSKPGTHEFSTLRVPVAVWLPPLNIGDGYC